MIVGHSSDDDKIIKEIYFASGAKYFEKKPAIINNFKTIVSEIINKN